MESEPVSMRQAIIDYVYLAHRIYMEAPHADDQDEHDRYHRAFEAFYSRYGDSPFVTDDRPTPNRPVYLRR